jgi:hypothetical protein
MASDTNAAIRPYSMAVAAFSSRRNRHSKRVIVDPLAKTVASSR